MKLVRDLKIILIVLSAGKKKQVLPILNVSFEQIPNSWIICDTSIVNEKPQTAVIHIGSSDITKFNYGDLDVNDLADRILQIGLKCRYYPAESIAILSVLVRNDNYLNKFIWNKIFQ